MTSIRKETGISLQVLKTLQGQSANTVNNCTHNTFDNKLKKKHKLPQFTQYEIYV